MERDVEHAAVFVEDVLRTVAVVHVPVEDGHDYCYCYYYCYYYYCYYYYYYYCTVAVVHVPIEDGHALRAALECAARRHRDGVKETEALGTVPWLGLGLGLGLG